MNMVASSRMRSIADAVRNREAEPAVKAKGGKHQGACLPFSRFRSSRIGFRRVCMAARRLPRGQDRLLGRCGQMR
eukprot:6198941-Pleurochrysis_carterae.AAC.3